MYYALKLGKNGTSVSVHCVVSHFFNEKCGKRMLRWKGKEEGPKNTLFYSVPSFTWAVLKQTMVVTVFSPLICSAYIQLQLCSTNIDHKTEKKELHTVYSPGHSMLCRVHSLAVHNRCLLHHIFAFPLIYLCTH